LTDETQQAMTMAATWAELEMSAPELSSSGRQLLEARGGEAMLSTVRGDDVPRIHPVNVDIVDGRLYVFVIARSPKRTDLETDGRYALHPRRPCGAGRVLRPRPRIARDRRGTEGTGRIWLGIRGG